jgi:hypothetical protein
MVSAFHNILEPTTGVTFFNSDFKTDPTELLPSVVLVIAGEKRFPPPNFNLKIVRIQHGGRSLMLLDALLHWWEGSAGPGLKNVILLMSFDGKKTNNMVIGFGHMKWSRCFSLCLL